MFDNKLTGTSLKILLPLIIFCIFRDNLGKCNCEENVQDASVTRKLDKILTFLESLDAKYNQLNKTLHEKLSNVHDRPSCDVDKQSTMKRDGPLSRQHSNSRNLFLFNKLASDSNIINGLPIDINETNAPTDNLKVLGDSLENLGVVLRDQLASFRLEFGKRVWDQKYQLQTLTGQISLMKEECSLSLESWSGLRANMTSCGDRSMADAANSDRGETGLRASHVALIEKLVSQQLSATMKGFESEISNACKSSANQTGIHEVLENQSKKLDSLDEQVRASKTKLDSISSIVMQSASILSKSSASSSTGISELTYSNANDASSGNSTIEAKSASASAARTCVKPKISRKNSTDTSESSSGNSTMAWCNSKTNLVRPSSCQQLRLAGANCTGQYYVFVANSIMHVYCDMNMDSNDHGGGWTVILRRLDKSFMFVELDGSSVGLTRPQRQSQNSLLEEFKASQTNFGLDLLDYKRGFGQLNDWAEFFVGLDLLHHLTESDPYELQVDLETVGSAELHLKFDHLSVASEDKGFKIELGKCNHTEQVCAPVSGLNGSQFSPKSGTSGSWAWWSSRLAPKDQLDLTRPIGRQADGNILHLHWPNWQHSSEPLKRISMKIRKRRQPGFELLI